jgi:hypothetical protein
MPLERTTSSEHLLILTTTQGHTRHFTECAAPIILKEQCANNLLRTGEQVVLRTVLQG